MDNIVINGRIEKFDEEQQLVFGWASVSVKDGNLIKDSHDDIIKENELETASYDFVLNSRKAGEMHKTVEGIGDLVESIFFSTEKQKALGLEGAPLPIGWWVGFKKHHSPCAYILPQTTTGERTENQLGPQQQMLESARRHINEWRQTREERGFLSRGWVWNDTNGTRKENPQTSILGGWMIASLLTQRGLHTDYSNPGGNFWISIPSRKYLPSDILAKYRIHIKNMPLHNEDFEYGDWVKLETRLKATEGQMRLRPFLGFNEFRSMVIEEREPIIFDARDNAAIILRWYYSDERHKNRGGIKRQYDYPEPALSPTPPPSEFFSKMMLKLDNCVVRREYVLERTSNCQRRIPIRKPGIAKWRTARRRLTLGEKEALASAIVAKYSVGRCWTEDESMSSLEPTLNMMYSLIRRCYDARST